jgi:hypothetical protein
MYPAKPELSPREGADNAAVRHLPAKAGERLIVRELGLYIILAICRAIAR